MRKLFYCMAIAALPFLSACETDVLDPGNDGPSDDSIAEGLKEALKVGTDTAVSKLAITDGYFKDILVKILLPDEMENAISTFKSKQIDILGVSVTGEDIYTAGYPALGINALQSKEDDLIEGINRAAEAAANDVKPIFVDAITSMSIADARDILFGEDDAATEYLKATTGSALFDEYEPKIDAALNSVMIGDQAVATLYEDFVAEYNSILSTKVDPTGLISPDATIGSLASVNTVAATDLSEHATNKGLDGLYLKVSEEEKNIREDPLARVKDILVEIFSLLD